MDLIPLPQELQHKDKKTKTKTNKIVEVRARLAEKADTRDEKILAKTCVTLGEYLVSGKNHTIDALSGLIENMHRATLALQKEKLKRQNFRKKGK